MKRYSLVVILHLLLASPSAFTQTKDPKTAAPANGSSKSKPAADAEAELVLNARRANAQSLLINLAADARNFADQTLRARTQARVADALWELDRERSRTLFRNAWEAAELADAEGRARMQEDIRQQQAKTGKGGFVIASPPNLRREVLRLAARHDRALGEELLAKFKEQKERETANATNRQKNPLVSDEVTSQRLALARQLLDAGDTDRAMQFADPVLGMISMQSIDFLSYLREKQPAVADGRYAAMLTNAAMNPQSDANTVSILSSYIFTPHLYVSFTGNGTSTSQMAPDTIPANVAAQLRDSFFRTAAAILMRPLAPPGQDQTTSGPDGQYLVIKRLMPLFEQFAPPETTAALKAQLEALASVASRNAREGDEEWIQRGIGPEKPSADREQALLDQLDHAKTSAERDQLNLQIALILAEKGDLKARDYVARIDDMEVRNDARGYIDASMTLHAIEKKDAERALEIARTGQLTHLQRSWTLSQSAKLLAKTDRERALALIDAAAAEAGRIENSDADRPRAYFGVTNAMFLIERKSAWELIDDAIKAANSAEGFTGEDGQVTFRLITKGMRSINQHSASDFDVTGIFEAFAREDYDRAVDLARAFQRDAPRASAVLAIAHAILDEKKK